MRSGWRRPGVVTGVLLAAACSAPAPGPGSAPEARPAGSRDVITSEEIDRGQWRNAYELVRDLRPAWLRRRGPDSFENPGQIQVYVDGTRLGDIQVLRTLPTSDIRRLEWIDPVSAAGRWGLNHSHGVVHVLYGRPEARRGEPGRVPLATVRAGAADHPIPDPIPA